MQNQITNVINKTSPIGSMYWSGVETINVSGTDWVIGSKSITLPKGIYIISAHCELTAGDSRAFLNIQGMDLVEQYISIPSSVDFRRQTVTVFSQFQNNTTLRVKIFNAVKSTASMCEICALRIL